MERCHSCQGPIDPTTLRCQRCGRAQPAQTRQEPTRPAPGMSACPSCGVLMPRGARFCGDCGQALYPAAAKVAPLRKSSEVIPPAHGQPLTQSATPQPAPLATEQFGTMEPAAAPERRPLIAPSLTGSDQGRRGRINYLDFDLRIGPGSAGLYPVWVLRSPAGETQSSMRFPFDGAALHTQLELWQSALLHTGEGGRQGRSEREQVVQRFGQSLFDALLAGEIRSRYDVSLDAARRDGKGLRLRLHVEAPELAVVPWEYLYDGRQGDYLCLSLSTPVIRYLELPQPLRALKVRGPLRILALVASPKGLDPLDSASERQRLESALGDLVARGRVQLTWLSGQTSDDVQRAMRAGPWHIFHFIGHGGFDARAGEGVLALAHADGTAHLLSATNLARLLADHQSLRLVVLNACEGAKGTQQNLFSSTAAILAQHRIPSILAMQAEMSDTAALDLTRAFYQALAEGWPVDAAVAEARKAISLEQAGTLEWGTPVLYLRAPDGVLFDVQPPKKPASPEGTRDDWLKRGAQLVREQQFAEALLAYEQAIHLAPAFAPAYQQQAEVFLVLNRAEEALAACDQAIGLDPNLAAAFFSKAKVLRSQGRVAEALHASERGLEAAARRRGYRVSKVWARGVAGITSFLGVTLVSVLFGFAPVPASSPLLDLIRVYPLLSILIGGGVIAASVAALLFSRGPEPTGTVPQADQQLQRRLVFSNLLATTSTTLLILLLSVVLIRPPWCPMALCPVNPVYPGVHDANLDLYFTAVQSNVHVIPGDPAQYSLKNLPRAMNALELDNPQQPPYRVVLGIHSLQQGRFGLLIEEVDLVVVQVAPVPMPLNVWVEQQRTYDTNVYQVSYSTQGPGDLIPSTYVTFPDGNVQLVPGETDEIDLQVLPEVAVDLQFRIQVTYRVSNESQEQSLTLPNRFELIASDASNWHLYHLQGGGLAPNS